MPAKATRFVVKYRHRLDATIRLVAKADGIPTSVRTAALRALLLSRYDTLRAADFSEAAILRVVKGDRTHLRAIADAVGHRGHRLSTSLPEWSGRSVGRLFSGAQVEKLLAEVYGASAKGVDMQVGLKMDEPITGNGWRYVGVVEDTPSGKVAHEAKVRNDPRSDLLMQCRKDSALKGTKVSQVHWHSFEHGSKHSIGPDPDVLSCLMDSGIRSPMHPGP